MTFTSLGVEDAYIEVLMSKGIQEPSIVQKLAIPPISEGLDVIVHSGTGTGKTLAYVLPLLNKIDWQSTQLQALVIVPTQELAMQIVREIEALIGTGKTAPLIGGASLPRQIERLKKHPVIAVGTPGRLVELLKLRKLKLQSVNQLVIDEVDQVFALGQGTAREIESLLKAAPADRQLVFVTATVTEAVGHTADKWMVDPMTVQGQTQAEASAGVAHQYIVCERREKIDLVRRLIRTVQPVSALIFIKDTEVVGELEAKLRFAGLQVESLYGDAGKMERAAAMQRFASGKLRLLIASDVAARGIDVTRISHIINFEPPADGEQYIHRSGRTGRMGRSGAVITLVTPGERMQLHKLAGRLGIQLIEKQLSHGQWKDAGRRMPTSASARSEQAQPSRQTRQLKEPPKNKEQDRQGTGMPQRDIKQQSNAAPRNLGKDKEHNRKRDNKNKGAPRWLKEKQEQRPE